jgi:hypothetical protein
MKLNFRIMNIFWYDLKSSSFSKSNHKICKESTHAFTNSYLFNNDFLKHHLLGQIQSFFITSKKIHSKIHLHEKIIFGENDMQF